MFSGWRRCAGGAGGAGHAALSNGQGILSSLLSPSVPLLLGSCHRVTVCWVSPAAPGSECLIGIVLNWQWLVSSAQPPCHILIALVACSQTRPGAADNYCPAHSCRTALLPHHLEYSLMQHPNIAVPNPRGEPMFIYQESAYAV